MFPTWDETFLSLATVWSRRATCPRLSVGCVIVRDKQVLSSGYNGAPAGMPHCKDVGCIIEDGHCIRSEHAERNAVAQAAKQGIALNNSTAYVTYYPCHRCLNNLRQAGVREIVVQDTLNLGPNRATQEFLQESGVKYRVHRGIVQEVHILPEDADKMLTKIAGLIHESLGTERTAALAQSIKDLNPHLYSKKGG